MATTSQSAISTLTLSKVNITLWSSNVIKKYGCMQALCGAVIYMAGVICIAAFV